AGSGSLTRLVSLVSAGLRRCSSETVKFGSCSFLFCALTLGCLIVSRIWMMAARQSCQVIGLMVGAPIREMGNDLNELEEPLTEEGDSGHSDSEYDGRDGGGSYMHAAAEDHANSENVMGKQFSCPDPVLHRDSIGGTEKFMFRKYQKPYHVYSVFVDRSCDKYECSCKLWERLEIPCCHIFCVLKELEKEELLSRLVLRRWCKDAKVADSSSQHASVSPTDGFRVRYSALWSACLSLCFTAAQCTETYNTTITEVARMSREFESLGGIGQRSSRVQVGADETHILDPKIIRSKGAPRGSTNANNGRRCRRCLRFGHDRRNCTAMDDDVVDE
ncbi:hypothetical protein S245_063069, partial [Arachis hypogaea]